MSCESNGFNGAMGLDVSLRARNVKKVYNRISVSNKWRWNGKEKKQDPSEVLALGMLFVIFVELFAMLVHFSLT